MEIPKHKWHQAIAKRCSRRKFDGATLSGEHKIALKKIIEELNGEYETVRFQLVTEDAAAVFRGAVGSYGKVQNPPAYAAFIGQTGEARINEKIGYLGEAFILEATSLGLGTCWVAGFFDPKVVTRQIGLTEGERVFAVTPVGYPVQEKSLGEKIMSGFVGSTKRKSLETLSRGVALDKCPQWVKTSLEAARLAPSAVNRQPWRFVVGEDSITVALDKPGLALGVAKELDCGIAILHLEIGALEAGVSGNWEYLESPQVARFKI